MKHPTISDVAARAGVSKTTVSFVLNDSDRSISADTRQRVLAAAEELGYRPNAAAASLRGRRTRTIGFITDEVASSPYAGEMIRGAQEWAWEHDHMLLVVNTGGRADVEAAAAAEMVRRRVDGVLYAAMYTRRVSVPAEVKDLPLVLANGFQDEHPAQVLPDERSGGRAAASALIDAGHRAVAFIGGDTGLYAYDLREAAFREVLTEAGLDLDERLIRRVHARADGGYEVATDLLKNHELTGIVCGNDRIAMGVYDAARGLGLVVPDDVSVVGYDDQELARYLRPALTSVALPHYEVGRLACERLLAAVTEQSDTGGGQELVACPLVARDSVRHRL